MLFAISNNDYVKIYKLHITYLNNFLLLYRKLNVEHKQTLVRLYMQGNKLETTKKIYFED